MSTKWASCTLVSVPAFCFCPVCNCIFLFKCFSQKCPCFQWPPLRWTDTCCHHCPTHHHCSTCRPHPTHWTHKTGELLSKHHCCASGRLQSSAVRRLLTGDRCTRRETGTSLPEARNYRDLKYRDKKNWENGHVAYGAGTWQVYLCFVCLLLCIF